MEPCTRKLFKVDGGPMRTEGQVTVRISVGEFSIRHHIVVGTRAFWKWMR